MASNGDMNIPGPNYYGLYDGNSIIGYMDTHFFKYYSYNARLPLGARIAPESDIRKWHNDLHRDW